MAVDEPRYRLQVAQEFLNEAEQDAAAKRWASCVRHAQLTTELAAKGAIECWEPAPRTHALAQVIDDILVTRDLDPNVKKAMEELKVCTLQLDYEIHVKASYGDEDAHLTPSQLFHETDAQDALNCARQSFSLAQFIVAEMSKP